MRHPARLLWTISAISLAGCSTERYEGGFETSDIKARILTPAGHPAIGARVWLVKSNGDSAPATALDSVWTDSSGQALFEKPPTTEREKLGIDAQSGEWMAIHSGGLGRSDTATLTLSNAVEVSAPPDSTGAPPRLFVPGSHFVSKSSSANGAAVLSLPKGAWTVAVAHATGTVQAPVMIDSAPVILPVAPRRADTLHVGPDIALDSFQIEGEAVFADGTFPTLANWARYSASDPYQQFEFIPSLVSVVDSGRLKLGSRPKTSISEGADFNIAQAASWIGTGSLPDSGVLAIKFRFFVDPAYDSTLWRVLSLSDSSGNGVKLSFPPALAWSGSPDSALVPEYQSSVISKNFPVDGIELVRNTTWYFSWNPDSMEVFTTSGRIATIGLSGQFLGLQLNVKVYSYAGMGSSSIQVEQARLYRHR